MALLTPLGTLTAFTRGPDESAMASEEIFGARKFSSKTERMVRWRKIVK
jgi:hypothetical protein